MVPTSPSTMSPSAASNTFLYQSEADKPLASDFDDDMESEWLIDFGV